MTHKPSSSLVRSAAVFVCVPLMVAAAACDGSGDLGGGVFATTPGASVVTPRVDTIVAKSDGGGFIGPAPAGAACDRQVWSYSFALATGALTWSRCAVSGTGANASDYVPETGARTLTTSERDAARAAANAVKVSSRNSCGADKPTLSVEVRTGQTSKAYGDDFYSCTTMFDIYVESEGLDALAAMLSSLAHQ
jgi:hypothetical protein